MEHGAVEFAANNVKRALTCLSPNTRFAEGVNFEEGSFSFRHGTPKRGRLVEVGFKEDQALGGMAFRVRVEGY